MADERSYERGLEYFKSGNVESVSQALNSITARVFGTRTYEVRFWVESDSLESSCTCPWAEDGNFCKHLVAVGLTWLEKGSSGAERSRKPGKRKKEAEVTLDDVRAMLDALDKEQLKEMIMTQAARDHALGERLVTRTALNMKGGRAAAALNRTLGNAFRIGDFLPRDEVYDYAHRIGDVLDAVEELLAKGHAVEVIELAELGLENCESVLDQIDDSDGDMGEIRERLEGLHLEACRAAKPDPDALARRLFDWEMKSNWDIFHQAALTYADVLGPTGLAAYRKLAEALWARVPAVSPGSNRDTDTDRRFRITSIMEALAEASGDIEELVAIKSRDLSAAYYFLEIAEIYHKARQHDKALDWAERGVRAFPKRTDSRLREFLANEYHRRKRHPEAMALIWNEFADAPQLDRCQLLKRHAERVNQWPTWREDALAALREQIEQAKQKRQRREYGYWGRADHSELVRVFLWEGKVEEAWSEAQSGGCEDGLWMELAAKREKEHPADAITVYQRQVDRTINVKNNWAYSEAVRLLRRIQKLMSPLGRSREFLEFVADIRVRHKPKRNLMKLLDQTAWS
jgi:uncharacterized Zn finger protein